MELSKLSTRSAAAVLAVVAAFVLIGNSQIEKLDITTSRLIAQLGVPFVAICSFLTSIVCILHSLRCWRDRNRGESIAAVCFALVMITFCITFVGIGYAMWGGQFHAHG